MFVGFVSGLKAHPKEDGLSLSKKPHFETGSGFFDSLNHAEASCFSVIFVYYQADICEPGLKALRDYPSSRIPILIP